jgi:predicted cobalt transporter CbtA
MNPRAFLVRGLLVGLLAGFATFLVAHQVGEPHVERAIALEEAGSADEHTHDETGAADESAGHSHGDEDGGTEVSRSNQRTWGLLTGTLAVGIATGGIIALLSAFAVGRMGRLTPRQSTTVVALIGFAAYSLVPFLKYPATPPAVGNGDTIGERTGWYFLFVLLSVLAAVLCTVLVLRTWEQLGAFQATVIALAAYVAVVVVLGQVLPTVNEVGDFPADTLWFFRRASLLTLCTMWAVIGIGLAWAVGKLYERSSAETARRELAASL